MAIVKGFLQMTGSIKGVSFYTNVGSDKVIMRTKGGASKNRIAKGAEFEKLRKHQIEWAGCVLFARAVRGAVGELYRLADYNLSPVWTGMGKNLIKLDKEGEVGQRPVRLSTYKQALEGFSFNRKYPFNSVLRVSPTVEFNREMVSATVTFPRINTEIDLLNIQRLPYFRLIVCLGIVSDIVYKPTILSPYEAENIDVQGISISNISTWHSANDILPEQMMMAQLGEKFVPELTDTTTILVSIGVEFGTVGFGGEITEVKRAGCGKVVAVW